MGRFRAFFVLGLAIASASLGCRKAEPPLLSFDVATAELAKEQDRLKTLEKRTGELDRQLREALEKISVEYRAKLDKIEAQFAKEPRPVGDEAEAKQQQRLDRATHEVALESQQKKDAIERRFEDRRADLSHELSQQRQRVRKAYTERDRSAKAENKTLPPMSEGEQITGESDDLGLPPAPSDGDEPRDFSEADLDPAAELERRLRKLEEESARQSRGRLDRKVEEEEPEVEEDDLE